MGYVVLRFITTIFASLQSGSSSPPDLSSIPFTQFLPVGFGLAFAGIVVLARVGIAPRSTRDIEHDERAGGR